MLYIRNLPQSFHVRHSCTSKKSVEVFTDALEIDLKEAYIAYAVTNPVSLPANHQIRLSVS